MLRDRSQSTTVASSDRTYSDLQNGGGGTLSGANPGYTDYMSLMWDVGDGDKRRPNECLHLSFNCVLTNSPYNVYDNTDTSNAPLPRTEYFGYMPGNADLHLPVPVSPNTYIPVSARSLNDYEQCVFDAYNRFTNEYRAMDGAVSVAELRETPQLFNIWQRRKSIPTNVVNGFLNYSFGWRPVYSDLVSICKELRSLPKSVQGRLSKPKQLVRHYKFNFDDTIIDNADYLYHSDSTPYSWSGYHYEKSTERKRRVIVVTIRAFVKPKLGNPALLSKLGRYGLLPSLGTLWSLTKLSFVVDWFYNIGGAIENLQGSLTMDVSNVSAVLSDTRERTVVRYTKGTDGDRRSRWSEVHKYYYRSPMAIPLLPSLTFPRKPMQYVLLGLLALTNTSAGKRILRGADRYEDRVNRALNRLEARLNRATFKFRNSSLIKSGISWF